MKTPSCDILIWASIQPNKHGSFEDYICHLARACSQHDLEIVFALGDEITEPVKNLFCEYHVKYLLLSEKALNSTRVVLKVLKTYKPKLVHLHFISPCNLIIPACHLMGVSKLILTDHSSRRTNEESKGVFLSPLKRLRRRFCASMINHFIAVSGFVSDHIQSDYGVPREKITTIQNGVNLDRFSAVDSFEKAKLKQKLFNLSNSIFMVTFSGQLIKEKGIDVFLNATQKLLARRKDIFFIIVGEIQGTEFSEDSINQRLKKSIRFLGMRDDMEQILKTSDILVFPSTWQEAFGLVVTEAMSCGVPVVASKVGAIPEVISHMETGLLVSPIEPCDLAMGIEKLISNKEMRSNFGQSGRERAEKHFGLDKMVSRTVSLYHRELNE